VLLTGAAGCQAETKINACLPQALVAIQAPVECPESMVGIRPEKTNAETSTRNLILKELSLRMSSFLYFYKCIYIKKYIIIFSI
jgi:hypothetical protein